ncbi:OLC1v1019196C4 [Oldenlandia corymbosa var. corymbosa]|uniref:ubiquitinyl hydrolase 1 n=1 Tax=Oldenlandia corymbosa var. corymbosa TaxID=529605 RepID=A0AAV1EDC0_OLDCO|nr:OLC1v1019196C4 [Oldenlandia corymbosa var. corymbosa]
MGKKSKKKLKTGHKERKVSSASPRAAPQQSSTTSNIEATDDVATVKDKRTCPHLDKGVNLEKISAKLKSSEPIKCEDCRESGGRAGKGKAAKQGKKNGGGESRSNSKAVWVCFDCGHYSCGGVGYPAPQTHAARHARQEKHPLALQYGKPRIQWCFLCEMLIHVEKSKDEVDQKDVLHEVVKMMKVQPSDSPVSDTGDVWSGNASVTCGVISESTYTLTRKSCYSVKGLVNLGNTCFLNSVMQNLLALSMLREYFCKLEGSFGPLTAALKKLFTETYPESGLKNVVNPRSFFGSICAKAPQFGGYQQQDSHELLRCLLDGLSTEELSSRKLDKSFQEDGKSAPLVVDAIFGGQLLSSVTCWECKHSSLVYEPFLDLSLPVPTKKPPSRKPQQTARAKKPKAPPKRNSRNRQKIFRETDNQPSQDASADGQLSCSIQSCANVSGQTVVASGDSAYSVCSDAGVTADSNSLMTNSLSSTQLAQSSKASENVITSTSDCWLDVLDADADKFFQMEDPPMAFGPQGENAVQDDVPMQDSLECGGENVPIRIDAGNCSSQGAWLDQEEQEKSLNDQAINLPPIENLAIDDSGVRNVIEGEVEDGSGSCSLSCSQNLDLGIESSEKVSEEEPPLLLQDSEVLLLPYKEDTFAASEMPETALGNDHDTVDFDGFGDLFNEPEVANSSLKSSKIDNASKENQGLGAGFGGNASESEPDEVDNSNSPVSVESCLLHFTKPEILLKKEHAWQCENCSKVLQEQKRELRKKLQNSMLQHVVNNNADTSTTGMSHLYCSPGDLSQPSEVGHSCNGNSESGVLDTSVSSVMLYDGETEDKRACMLETGEEADSNPVASCLADQNCELEAPACESSSSQDGNFSNLNNYRNCNGCHVDEQKSDGFSDCDARKEAVQPENLSCEAEREDDQEEKQERVKVERDATKRILISRAPPILTIHLKRFSQDARGRLSKLNGYVQFNHTIDLKPFMDPRCTAVLNLLLKVEFHSFFICFSFL